MGKWQNHHPLKRTWMQKDEDYIRKNWEHKNNQELADHFNVCLTSMRTKLYEMGLKRMELEYWSQAQINFLLKNYKTIGDVEMAELFQKKWHKDKGWTHKHIEKKRRYLKLNRTKKEIAAIKQRNIDKGRFSQCVVKRWATTGQAKEKEIRYWRKSSGDFIPCIKINGRFIHWARWRWEQKHGELLSNMLVYFKDGNAYNRTLRNLAVRSREDHARANALASNGVLSDNYVVGMLTHGNPELRDEIRQNKSLIELKRKQLQLNRLINEKVNGKA